MAGSGNGCSDCSLSSPAKLTLGNVALGNFFISDGKHLKTSYFFSSVSIRRSFALLCVGPEHKIPNRIHQSLWFRRGKRRKRLRAVNSVRGGAYERASEPASLSRTSLQIKTLPFDLCGMKSQCSAAQRARGRRRLLSKAL